CNSWPVEANRITPYLPANIGKPPAHARLTPASRLSRGRSFGVSPGVRGYTGNEYEEKTASVVVVWITIQQHEGIRF
ncbi:hypothetical protein, partial [Nocardia abscessus]|uniref:hypothetical protein n=1 Tax=Nocardia abscessus TaxID=120957 RepID=UPI00245611B8